MAAGEFEDIGSRGYDAAAECGTDAYGYAECHDVEGDYEQHVLPKKSDDSIFTGVCRYFNVHFHKFSAKLRKIGDMVEGLLSDGVGSRIYVVGG